VIVPKQVRQVPLRQELGHCNPPISMESSNVSVAQASHCCPLGSSLMVNSSGVWGVVMGEKIEKMRNVTADCDGIGHV